MPRNRRNAAAVKPTTLAKRGTSAVDILSGTQEQVTARLRELFVGKDINAAKNGLLHVFRDRPDKIKSINSIFDDGMHCVFFAMAEKVAVEHEDWASARFYNGMFEVFDDLKE